MFERGDVVRFHSAYAGKEKFHLCLGSFKETTVYLFLNINSKDGFVGDCIMEDGRIPGLPKSPTEQTIVSFSMLVRRSEQKLQSLGATKTGAIDETLAGELLAFARTSRTLTDIDKPIVIEAFERMIGS